MSGRAMLLAPTLEGLDTSPRRGLDRVAALGFRAVQLGAAQAGFRPADLDRSGRRDLLASLRRREIAPAGLDFFLPLRAYADPHRQDRAMADLLAAIELAGQLDRCPLSVRLPPAGAGPLVAAAAAAVAERWGVPLADHQVETLPPEPLRLGLDPAAWLAASADPVQAVHDHGPRLACARLVDLLRTGARGPVGDEADGRLDVVAYRVALSVAGYDRPVVVDTRQWPDPVGGLERSRAAWEQVER